MRESKTDLFSIVDQVIVPSLSQGGDRVLLFEAVTLHESTAFQSQYWVGST